jgi:hypothetical protein
LAYCTYFSNMSAEDVERQQKALLADRGEDDTQRIGLGQSAGMLQLEKPLDMKLFVQDMPPTGSLSIAKYKDTSSQMTAWVTLDEGHVMLPFPIVSSLSSSFPVNTRGRISATTEKTRHPKFPSDLMKDPAVGRG